MKKNIGLAVVLVLIVIAISTFIKQQTDKNNKIAQVGYEVDLTQEEGLQKGQIAPDFTLQTLTGESVTLSDLKGKKVILNFWASWCPPCRAEMPHLQEYYEKYADADNVTIIAANTTYNDQGAENVQKFVNSYDITFPVLLMPEDNIIKLYEVLTIPSTLMIDTEGRIQYYIQGPLDEEAIREYIAKLD
ncbi:TlpA family protein disulfide reductase [Lysinibacillus sp. LZ02]|uniref:TlpA family protein disulfide reductase n=1 Tax=Lysinibacillus sp. LZ02 TaxID=3420668 RepID=UPI003D35A6AC